MAQCRSSNSLRRDNAVIMIENVAAWFKTNGNSATLAQLEVHADDVEHWQHVFSENQEKVELKAVDDEALKQERDIRRQFNENYLEAKASLQQQIALKNPRTVKEDSSTRGTASANATHSLAFATHAGIHLRPVGGLQFTGDRKEWHLFWEKFRTLYHNNELLSPAEKLICLQDCCKDDAYAKLHRLEPTDANYKAAIEILKQNYEDVQLACHDHVAAICNLPMVPKDDVFALRTFVDELNVHLRALSSLDRPVDSWCDLIIYLAKTKLYRNIVVDWQRESIDERFPCHTTFIKFLQRRVQILERVNSDSRSSSSKQLTSVGAQRKPDTKTPPRARGSTLVTSDSRQSMDERKPCPVCSATTHFIQRCRRFQALTVGQRRDTIKRLKICENCLRDHGSAACKSQSRCLICQQNHHTLIHREGSIAQHKAIEKTPPVHQDQQPTSSVVETEGSTLVAAPPNSTKLREQTSVLLPTALVNVRRKDGTILSCRCLIDPCSSFHLVTEEFAQLLKVSRIRCSQTISAAGEQQLVSSWLIPIIVQSRTSDFWTELEAHVVRTITLPQPGNTVDVTTIKLPQDIPMADPGFHKPQKIDLLIGAELFNELLKHSQPILHKNLLNTHFGWIVLGRLPSSLRPGTGSCNVVSSTNTGTKQSTLINLTNLMERFWSIEESAPGPKPLTADEEAVETHYVQTTRRNQDGRFQVRLPFKKSPDVLGDSRRIAEGCFRRLESAFKVNNELKSQYTDFVHEILQLGHMQLATPNQLQPPNFYLPHHHVARPDSTTTKLRVVFNGSAKTSNSLSLNDILFTGPIVQSELFAIILRARLQPYVLSADIMKMFRQIEVHPDDQRYQLILWRDSQDEPIRVYALNRIVYGLACSPFLATRCLKKLAEENENCYPIAARAIIENCYVDNILSGADTIETTKTLCRQLKELLQTAKFELHKWCSNEPAVLADIAPDRLEKKIDIDGTMTGVKTLGLIWDGLDNFRYVVNDHGGLSNSKRTILSDISRIFDPLSLASPVIVPAKGLMQELWTQKVNWDEPVDQPLLRRWEEYRMTLPNLRELVIPRLVYPAGSEITLHCFSDASKAAYGTAVYIVAHRKGIPIACNLLCARSRISPLKVQTIARLELCAALLGVELVQRLKEIIGMPNISTTFWTDSEITLHWISKPAYNWDTFVCNRVQKIQNVVSSQQWRYVPSALNAADLVSRGVPAETFHYQTIWFQGPPFLLESKFAWPAQPSFLQTDVPEKRKSKEVTLAISIRRDLILSTHIYNSFTRLQRCFAWIVRWRMNAKTTVTEQKMRGSLTSEELEHAQRLIIRYVQRTVFAADIKNIESGKELTKDSNLRTMNPLIDSDGILRLGGRLHNADIPTDARQPAILPSNHPVVAALFRYWHEKLLHAGPKTMLGHIRNYFWPIRGSQLARKTASRCIVCFRCKPTLTRQQMGQLPPCRVRRCDFPFQETGIDYCGPFSMSQGGRGRQTLKMYIAVFVCMATRAVHLDTVLDLSTPAFLATLRRFIARRGCCQRLHSDNMKAFVGAKSELAHLYEALDKASDSIQNELAPIEWTFIPPRAPHQGGLWEAAVKSAKFHMKRCLPSTPMTHDEWNTLLTQIEAVLNSRPIARLPDTTDAVDALTPGHFIIGAPMKALPERSLTTDGNISYLTRWRRVQAARDHFWTRWSSEYLHTLQKRAKWHLRTPDIKLHQVVLVKDDNAPPQHWRYGLVTRLHPGKDGITRVVTIRSAGREYVRDIRSIAPLPDNGDDSWPDCVSPTEAGMLNEE